MSNKVGIEYTGAASPAAGGGYFITAWDGTNYTGSFGGSPVLEFDEDVPAEDFEIKQCIAKIILVEGDDTKPHTITPPKREA